MGLTTQLQRALSLSFLDKYVGYTLRFIATLFIARLCTPEEIGIFSVAFVMISIGHVIRDFGVSQYLIHEKEIDPIKIRASFTLMWIIAWGLWLLLWVSKGWISHFYDEPDLIHAIEILSFIYLLAPFGSVRIALLRRHMNFKALAIINVGSYVILHGVTIGLAFLGWGYKALVWGQVAGVLMIVTGTFIFSPPCCWQWPGFKGMRAVLRFGMPVCFANIIETTAEGAPDLILGRTMSMMAVGFMGRAQGLMNLFKVAVTSAVWPVVLPYFSQKNRDGEHLLPDYLSAIEIYTILAWPFFMGLSIFAEPIVYILFGDQWLSIIPLVKILAIVAILQACFPFFNALLVAKGEVQLNFKLQGCLSFLRVFAVGAGAFISLKAVCYFLIVAEIIGFIVIFTGIRHAFGLTWKSYQSHIQPSVNMLVMMTLSIAFVKWITPMIYEHQIIDLMIGVVFGLVFWLAILKYQNHRIYPMIGSLMKFKNWQGALRGKS